jgi:methanogenic corrinoid protein MtbC1
VKVLIGGAAVSEEFAKEIGADAYCVDGFEAIKALEGFEEAAG